MWSVIKPPHKLWTDKGGEFFNSYMKEILKKYNVEHYTTENEEKSSIIERWNRTMRNKISQYLTAANTNTYYDALPDILREYNHTKHRTIGTTPSFAQRVSYHKQVFDKLYKDKSATIKAPVFKVGDKVRISRKKDFFEKESSENWTEEILNVYKINHSNPITYVLKDYLGNELNGTFYKEELQKTDLEEYRIQKILKERIFNGRKQYWAKFMGYTDEFNDWVNAEDIEDI